MIYRSWQGSTFDDYYESEDVFKTTVAQQINVTMEQVMITKTTKCMVMIPNVQVEELKQDLSLEFCTGKTQYLSHINGDISKTS